jgi:glutaminyl-tRNA synthetase
MTIEETKSTDFIREAVAEDLKNGRFNYVRTRLPPEPNGYLHRACQSVHDRLFGR